MNHLDEFYIDGAWVEPLKATRFQLTDPVTEEAGVNIALGGVEDVDRAVSAARRAFPAFNQTSVADRIRLLERIVESFRAREDDIMAAVTQEMGAPISMRAHVEAGLEGFQQALATLKDFPFETRLGDTIIRREAIGVCGLITPWNWPVQLVANKLGSSLAAGCTIVLKPSEYSPLSALVLAEVLDAAGVPKGVFNLVNGDGPTVGHAISAHPAIDVVSFTGSTRAGVLVAEAAAPTVKRVCQELGGKSANIILPDADLDATARWNVARGFSNSGQSCHAPTRVLVHEEQQEQLLAVMREEAGKVKAGDPNDPVTTMGPVVNRSQYERIQQFIQSAMDEGARLVCGGLGRPAGLDRGYFVQPTVFADVTPDMVVAREEIFGPVLSVMTYSSLEQAIEIANATSYGLGAYVFSSDRETALTVGRRLRAGRVFCNGAPPRPDAPMGGYKRSGNGREMGTFGLEEYLEVKAMFGYLDAPCG